MSNLTPWEQQEMSQLLLRAQGQVYPPLLPHEEQRLRELVAKANPAMAGGEITLAQIVVAGLIVLGMASFLAWLAGRE